MPFQNVFLWTDTLLWGLLVVFIMFLAWARHQVPLILAWKKIATKPLSVISMVVLIAFCFVAYLDSIHFSLRLNTPSHNSAVHYSPTVHSLLDVLMGPIARHTEKTYSAPFALYAYSKETMTAADGSISRDYPRLQFAGAHLADPSLKGRDILVRCWIAFGVTIIVGALFTAITILLLKVMRRVSLREAYSVLFKPSGYFPWNVWLATVHVVLFLAVLIAVLGTEYHILGTNKVGSDVLFQTLKSIRTGIVIGTLTTLMMLPFAILLGIMAGYFGGFIDDVIQYVYTTLSSIPGVLLIAASILSLQIFISSHPNWFQSLSAQADARLLALCAILGVTSWTGLCRLLRAETLKIREIDYIQAARSLGTGHFKIIFKHILPNVFHIVLIAVVLDFSMLVLAEAVLSYVGVGVDPSSISWGNMINSARLELAREPVVWWPLLAAFIFMFILVLSANLFADAVRDGLDPRSQQ